jgi:hypothetical protein
MGNEIKILYAKSHRHGLLREGKIPKIGEVQTCKGMQPNGVLTQIQLVTFDWFGNGEKDIFVFGEAGMITSVIHANTSQEMIDKYIARIALYTKLDRFVDNMISYFVFSSMGF